MSKTLLTYTTFVIACLFVVVAFITATTYTQLAAGILLYPLLVFFSFKVFPLKKRLHRLQKPAISKEPPLTSSAVKADEVKRENVGISDIDKRVFLKLIGATGISLFLFSLFSKKAEGIVFRNLPGSGRIAIEDTAGNKIDPAQSQPMDGFRISEIDDNLISFYGYTDKDGSWYVLRIDTDTGSFRYARGDSNFPGNWNNRENLNYDYFNNVF